MSLLAALLLAQVSLADEGGAKKVVNHLNCVGAGITCSSTSTFGTITVSGGGAGAPTNSTYITQTCNASLSAEQCLSANSTGIMASTTTTGVVSTYAPLASVDDQVLVSDSSSAATWRTLPNCTDTGGNHLNYTASTNGWSCGTSQLHDVGGSSPQVQYNNAGAFGGVSKVESDGTHVQRLAVANPPAAPAVGKGTAFLLQFDGGMPSSPYDIEGYYGIPTPDGLRSMFTYYSTTAKWSPMCWMPHGWGATTINAYNTIAPQTVANLASASWAVTSSITRSKSLRFSTSAAANQNAGIKAATSTQMVWRGNTAGAGGWLLWSRWSMFTNQNHVRAAVGLVNSATFPPTTAEPSTLTDAVYVGCDSVSTAGATNMSICSNDNSGSATCATLGASFPCDATSGTFYDVWLSAAPNASSIEFYVERLDSAASAQGSIVTDLPRNTVQLNPLVYANTADGGSALAVEWMGTCVLANL